MSMTKRELAAQNEALRELLANVQAVLGDTLAEMDDADLDSEDDSEEG